MKDFSLLYGPARTWAVIVGTVLIAVAIALFAQGRGDGGGQEVQAEIEADRSSSQSEVTEEEETVEEDEVETGEESADVWARAPQSASDIPFVSLRPSPEAITEAGEDLVSANTSTIPRSAPAEPVPTPAAPAAPNNDPEPPRTTAPAPEPVVNTTEPSPTTEGSSSCQATGDSRFEAIVNYRLSCSLPRRDCDPLSDGGWICSSERI